MNDTWKKFAEVLDTVEVLVKDQSADAGKFVIKYANINQIIHMLKPILNDHGLALTQPIVFVDGHNMVTTTLIDTDTGDTLDFPGPAFPTKGDPQQAGSAITYFRRYGLVSLFALESEDDDGGIAHRAVATPTKRTGAEGELRAMISGMTKDDRTLFVQDFKEEFNSTLADLPESRHGEALAFGKFWSVEVVDGGDEEAAAAVDGL